MPASDFDVELWAFSAQLAAADAGRLRLVVHGRIGAAAAPAFARALADAVASASCIVLDLADVDYLSSAGLHVMERAADSLRAAGGALTIGAASEPVTVTLRLAGVEVDIEHSRLLERQDAPAGPPS